LDKQRLLKLLNSVIFSSKHPFWNAPTPARQYCASRIAGPALLDLADTAGSLAFFDRARSRFLIGPGAHTEILEDRLRLFEAKPFEPAHDGLDNPVRNVLLWDERRTARNCVKFTDTDSWHTQCMP
jgi:hypothetical protein